MYLSGEALIIVNRGVWVIIVDVQQIRADRNALSDTDTLDAPYFPSSVLCAPVFTAVMAAGKEVRVVLCYHGNLFCSLTEFIISLCRMNLIKRWLERKMNHLLRSLMALWAPLFELGSFSVKAPGIFLAVKGKEKKRKTQKLFCWRGDKKAQYTRKQFRKEKKLLTHRCNQRKSISASGYVNEIYDTLWLWISNNKIRHEFFWESVWISSSFSFRLIEN